LLLVVPSLLAEEKVAAVKAKRPLRKLAESENDGNLLYIKARQKALAGDYEGALPLLEKAVLESPEDPFIHHQLAETYFRLGRLEEAEKSGIKAVEANPKNTDYLTTLGGIYATLKKYDLAKTQYEKLLEL